MTVANLHEAGSQLSKLIELAEQGEEVIIARAGKPVARLVPYGGSSVPREGGQWKDRVRIAPDFDALPPDLAEAFGAEER
jgi:prevent-host-death family protein